MLRTLFYVSKLFLPKFVRDLLVQLIFVHIPLFISYISVTNYRIPRGLTQHHIASIPENLSVGDPLIYLFYTKLLSEEQSRPIYCIIPDVDICKEYVKFLIGKNSDCHVYSEPIYNWLMQRFPRFRDITSNFGRNLNIYIGRRLRQKLESMGYSPIRFYKPGYEKQNIGVRDIFFVAGKIVKKNKPVPCHAVKERAIFHYCAEGLIVVEIR